MAAGVSSLRHSRRIRLFLGSKSDCRPRRAASPPRVARFNSSVGGASNMSVCYIREDNEIDAERCRISLREKSPITLFTLDRAGRALCLTGVVQSMQFDPDRAAGTRWRVVMDLSTVASYPSRTRKTRQRTP
jgi:hypothetical protein